MQTREAPDFWGLHKNKNCAFPLNITVLKSRFKTLTVKVPYNGIFQDQKFTKIGACNYTKNELRQEF